MVVSVVAAEVEGAFVVGVVAVVTGEAIVLLVVLVATEAEGREECPIEYPVPPATRATPMTRATTINDRLVTVKATASLGDEGSAIAAGLHRCPLSLGWRCVVHQASARYVRCQKILGRGGRRPGSVQS